MKASFPVKAKLADGCRVGLALGVNAVRAGDSLVHTDQRELERFHATIHAIAERHHKAELARVKATAPKPLSLAAQARVRKAAKVPMVPVSKLHRHTRKCRITVGDHELGDQSRYVYGTGASRAGSIFTAANGKKYQRLAAGTVRAFMGRKLPRDKNPGESDLTTHTAAYWYAVQWCSVLAVPIPVFPLPGWLRAELKRLEAEARRAAKAEAASA